jgi:putative ABC transport system permease protein
VNALHRKLLRDAWRMRGPMSAVAAVVACGIALFVALRSMHQYLVGAQAAYYADQRFAHVFAHVSRAPAGVARRIERIAGVAAVRARIVRDVRLSVPWMREPATARLVSIPVPRRSGLNDLVLRRGRWPSRGRAAEVLVSDAFARANALSPGDTLRAIIAGRRRELVVVGTAISPEFVYEIRSGFEVFPDPRRFGVVWMGDGAAAAALGMAGEVNDVAVALAAGASESAVIGEMDRVLAPYGGEGAYGREHHVSHRFVSDEIRETGVTSMLIPAIFLAVTAFLVSVVLSRVVNTQREQAAVLRAFGYGRAAVGLHYLQLAALPAAAGAVAGAALGVRLARGIARIYTRFYQFPEHGYRQDPRVVAAALAIGAGAALAGAAGAAWRAASLPPAEAMRPEPPARFRAGFVERSGLARLASPAARMVVRGIARRPLRAGMSVSGVALAMGMVVAALFIFDAIAHMRDVFFQQVQRADATVVFDDPRPPGALGEVARLPGVLRVDPFRSVDARLRHGHRAQRVGLTGLSARTELRRIVGAAGERRRAPPGGVLLTAALAAKLGAAPGDTVWLEVLEGARPVRPVVVSGTVDEVMGLSAYMEIGRLHALLDEGANLSGAWMRVDGARADELYARLYDRPRVSGVSVRTASLRGFTRSVNESFRTSVDVLIAFACVLAAGIVYNGARVALSERARELASLRVLGFTRREVAAMLLGEQALLTAAAIPAGFAVGRLLATLVALRFGSDLFRIPLAIRHQTYVTAAAVVLVAAAVSSAIVAFRIARLDLVRVLKSRE